MASGLYALFCFAAAASEVYLMKNDLLRDAGEARGGGEGIDCAAAGAAPPVHCIAGGHGQAERACLRFGLPPVLLVCLTSLGSGASRVTKKCRGTRSKARPNSIIIILE